MFSLIFKVFHIRFLMFNLFTFLFLTGCVNRNISEMVSSNHLALAELNPQLRFEQEVMVVRLTQVLQEAKLSPAERADLHFERGVLYDSLGLWSLARYDFAQAIGLSQKWLQPITIWVYICYLKMITTALLMPSMPY
ncbi:lipoprotein NlpI [Actinobacillus equuli]|nr:lipoprotein NlpI [Actinobacillus equuli]